MICMQNTNYEDLLVCFGDGNGGGGGRVIDVEEVCLLLKSPEEKGKNIYILHA